MMTLDRIMANMPMEEREIIMDKMVAASRDILGTIADMGYLDEYETPLTPMEERGYYDEEGNLDIDAVEADGYEFGMDLAFGVLSVCEGKPEHVLEIQKYVNEQYECCSNKKFMKVLETIARMNGNEEVYIEDMYACNKEASRTTAGNGSGADDKCQRGSREAISKRRGTEPKTGAAVRIKCTSQYG